VKKNTVQFMMVGNYVWSVEKHRVMGRDRSA